jgi:hypothetical protein
MRNITHEMEKSIESDNWIYESPFWNYPLEIEFLNKNDYIKFSSKSHNEREKYYSNMLDDLNNNNETKFVDAFSIFLDYIIHNKNPSNQKEMINKYLLEYHKLLLDQITPDNYTEFLNKSIKSIDVYGLGMSLYYLLNCSTTFLKPEIIELMESCFFNMTTPNLLQRFTIEEALDTYENILMKSGFMDEFGLNFQKHEIVEKNKMSNILLKKIHNIKSKNISIRRISKSRLENALEMPICLDGYEINTRTRKCEKINYNNKTRRSRIVKKRSLRE